jgi:hypothetical protein
MRQIEGFKKHLVLLQIACNRGMKERHWAQVSKIAGFHIRPDTTSDLSKAWRWRGFCSRCGAACHARLPFFLRCCS